MTDDQLWVELTPAWSPGRWLIVGSAHTHRGHFSVTRVDGPGYASVNKTDVAVMSPPGRLVVGRLPGRRGTQPERVPRRWRSGVWAPADPQPGEPDEVAWPGSDCARPDGHHSMEVVDTMAICERCHWVSA